MGKLEPPFSTNVTILLPTLNEEYGLARTLEEIPFDALRSRGVNASVLVVDGHSTDATRKVALEHGAEVIDQVGKGKGQAVREGLEHAMRRGSELLVTLDADFTYSAATILPLVSLLTEGSDLAIGVRQPQFEESPGARAWVHRAGDLLLDLLASGLSRTPFLDICSGLWGVRLASVQAITLESEGFEIESELFLKMARAGYSVAQIPVTYRSRVGVAKLRALPDGSRIFLSIIRFARRAPPYPPSVLGRPYGAFPTVHSDRPRDSIQLLHAIQGVCSAINPTMLTICSDAERLPQAEELARRLRSGQVRVDVVVEPDPANGNGPHAPVCAKDIHRLDPKTLSHPVVRLPALLGTSGYPETAIVGIPESDRLVYLACGDSSGTPEPNFAQSGGYRLESSGKGPSALTAIFQHLYRTPFSKELAMLSANAKDVELEVFRRPPDAPPESIPGTLETRGSFPSR